MPCMHKEIKIETEYIELFKLLKFANIIESGAQAKIYIEEGLVFLNGEQEFRKRAKVRKGDTIKVEHITLSVI